MGLLRVSLLGFGSLALVYSLSEVTGSSGLASVPHSTDGAVVIVDEVVPGRGRGQGRGHENPRGHDRGQGL